MNKNNMRFKGQLRTYMQWPVIMTALLLAMNIWMYKIDRKAGAVMSVFIVIYAVIVGLLYFYNRSLILADLIQFATQYKGIQNTLLKELTVPYAITLEDGRLLWENDSFLDIINEEKRKKYLNKLIPELNTGVFPKTENDYVEMEVTYRDRNYQVELRKFSMEGFSEAEKLLQIPKENEYFIALCMKGERRSEVYCRPDLH